MARIQSYPIASETDITADDYLLGNDLNDGSVITKRFTVSALRDHFLQQFDGTDITQKVPQGFTGAVTQDGGTTVHRSPVGVVRTPAMTGTALDFNLTTVNADSIDVNLAGATGVVTLKFYGYREKYDLDTFPAGTIVTAVDGANTYTGAVGSLRKFDLEGNEATDGIRDFRYEDGNYVYWLDVTGFTPGISTSIIGVDSLSFTNTPVSYDAEFSGSLNVTENFSTGGNITATGELRVDGNVDFNGTDIQIGSDDSRSEVHIHGTAHFDDPNEGIVFGPTETGDPADMTTTTFTVDTAGNLSIDGAPSGDLPSFTFTENVAVTTAAPLTTNGITNAGTIVQDGDITIEGDVTIFAEDDMGNRTSSVTLGADGTITTVNEDGSSGPELREVLANEPTAALFDDLPSINQLNSIYIDGKTFSLPELSAGVAEALPGLNEELDGSPATELDGTTPRTEFTLGRFFYGLEQSAGAIDITQVDNIFTDTTTAIFSGIAATTAPNVPVGDIAFAWFADSSSPTADETARRDRFEAYYDARPSDHAVFFVESGYTDAIGASIDDSVTRVYEVIAYNDFDDIVTFGLLGGGTLNLATETINISADNVILGSIPVETFNPATPEFHQFVTIDAGNTLSKSGLNISGAANGARYTDTDETDQAISAFQFDGHNADGDSGVVTIDTSGRYKTPILINDTPAAPVTIFDTIILQPTDGGTDKSFTLPIGGPGDSIKVVNTSTVDVTNPGTPATTGEWSIFPNTTQSIMGINTGNTPMGETTQLELDDPTASFELLYSGDDDLGWVIIGIN